MKAIVVYDTKWGNTEKIAQAIAAGFGAGTKTVKVENPSASEYASYDLLILGSPILGGRPSETIRRYINAIPQSATAKLKIATFDTRLKAKLAKIFGRASEKMADSLKAKGFVLVSRPEGFAVIGRSGPLSDGEIERATQWGKELVQACLKG